MMPVWNEAKKKHSNKFDMVDLDCSSDYQECQKYQIRGYPTILVEKNNAIVKTIGGYKPLEVLEQDMENV